MHPNKRVVHSVWMSLGLALAVALAVFILGALGEEPSAARGVELAHTSDNLLRLHVIAHSDAPRDQNAKLKVRDAVLREMAGWQEPSDPAELEQWVKEREDALIRAAERALIESGQAREVRVEVGSFPFPRKSWGDLVLPAGQYRAVRVVIGDGAGQNWWCVLFPPLCFVEESGEPAAPQRAIAHAQERSDDSDPLFEGIDGSRDVSQEAVREPAEVEWRIRLWEDLSESAAAGRVRELVDASLEMIKRLSP